MSEPAAAPKAKKVSKPKKAAEHPPFKTLTVEAIAALKEVRHLPDLKFPRNNACCLELVGPQTIAI